MRAVETTKRLAENKKTVIRIPIVLNIVRVQLALGTVPVEVRDVAIAVSIGEHASYCAGAITIITDQTNLSVEFYSGP